MDNKKSDLAPYSKKLLEKKGLAANREHRLSAELRKNLLRRKKAEKKPVDKV